MGLSFSLLYPQLNKWALFAPGVCRLVNSKPSCYSNHFLLLGEVANATAQPSPIANPLPPASAQAFPRLHCSCVLPAPPPQPAPPNQNHPRGGRILSYLIHITIAGAVQTKASEAFGATTNGEERTPQISATRVYQGNRVYMAKLVDIAKLANSMKRELDYYWSLDEGLDKAASSCMIYKVQNHIREVDKFSYQPLVISIGPYHHGVAALDSMQKEKWIYLDYMLKLNCERSLYEYLSAMEGLAKQARNCYAEDIKMNDDEFLQLLLLDGSFILVILGATERVLQHRLQSCREENLQETITERGNGSDEVKSTESTSINQEDTVNNGNETVEVERDQYDQVGHWFIRYVNHDLYLLENQIPFFVIIKLLELLVGHETMLPPIINDLVSHVETALRWYPKSIQETDRPKNFHHLLHLCHIYFKPSKKPEEAQDDQTGPHYLHKFLSFGRKYLKVGYHHEDHEPIFSSNQGVNDLQTGQQLNRWRRAAQYLEAGVKFKKREYDNLDPHSLLDVRFTNGSMEMPCIVIDESTGALFRNLIAFEQTCPQFGDDFTAYIVFLSQLVSMPEDVTLLAQREIIVHHLDSDMHVSDLFTMLSKDVVFDFNGTYYLKSLCQIMEDHYQSRLNRWMAWLWMNHFSNPWMGLAAAATVIVLVCTVLQTIFGILAYVNPP
ncbi:hypothetical protein ACP70R_010846 [Stipagrostis hirtigluma subsp. patula]